MRKIPCNVVGVVAASLSVLAVAAGWAMAAEVGTIDPASGKPCYRCHPSKLDGKNIHEPLSGKECTPCHNTEGGDHQFKKGLFAVKVRGAKLCYDCHDNLSSEKSVHGPIQEGECGDCHAPHNSPNKKLLRFTGSRLCFQCHDVKGFEKKKFPHAPVADGACLDCHSPHQAKAAKLIRQSQPLICFNCHDSALAEGKSVHMPVASGECESCHAVHGSDNARLLKTGFPAEYNLPYSDNRYALCFTCHDSKSMTEEETENATAFRDGRQNLHYLHVNSKNGLNCTVCHDVHSSRQERLIKEKSGKGKDEVTIDYKATSDGGNCTVSCHDAVSYKR